MTKQLSELIEMIEQLSSNMYQVALKMEEMEKDYPGIAEHGNELMGASKIADGWAEGMSEEFMVVIEETK